MFGLGDLGGLSMGSSLLGGLLGGSPFGSANDYLSQIPGIIHQYSDPYVNAGNSALGVLSPALQGLVQNPGQTYNQLSGNFQQSPGYNFSLQQALAGSNNAAAAGGLSGSPMHQQQNMGIASGLASQNFNNYMNQIQGLYGMGLSGLQGQTNLGWDASKTAMEDLASLLGSQGAYAAQGTAGKNLGISQLLGGASSVLGGGGGFGGLGGGGGMGGGLGSMDLSSLGSMFGGGGMDIGSMLGGLF